MLRKRYQDFLDSFFSHLKKLVQNLISNDPFAFQEESKETDPLIHHQKVANSTPEISKSCQGTVRTIRDNVDRTNRTYTKIYNIIYKYEINHFKYSTNKMLSHNLSLIGCR